MSEQNQQDECICQKCRRDYPVWFVDSKYWNEVMRNEDGSDKYSFLCIDCFAVVFEEKNDVIRWELVPNPYEGKRKNLVHFRSRI